MAWLIAAAGFVLVSGYVVLTLFGRQTDGYIVFVTGPLVSTLVGITLSRKVGKVQETANIVQHATDGLLTARLDTVDESLASAHRERSAMDGYRGMGPDAVPDGQTRLAGA